MLSILKGATSECFPHPPQRTCRRSSLYNQPSPCSLRPPLPLPQQSHVAVASSYRPPPVAPGAAPAPHGDAAYEKANQYGYGGGGYNNGGNAPALAPAAPLPEAKAVPYVGGVAGDDPFNARGAAAAAATGGGARPSAASSYSAGAYGGPAAAGGRSNAAAGIAGRTGAYPSLSSHPAPSSLYQPNQGRGQQQQHQYRNNDTRYGHM